MQGVDVKNVVDEYFPVDDSFSKTHPASLKLEGLDFYHEHNIPHMVKDLMTSELGPMDWSLTDRWESSGEYVHHVYNTPHILEVDIYFHTDSVSTFVGYKDDLDDLDLGHTVLRTKSQVKLDSFMTVRRFATGVCELVAEEIEEAMQEVFCHADLLFGDLSSYREVIDV